MRHCENELGLASCVAACIEVEAAAATQPSERIVPVLAKVFEPWKLKGTSLSPMAASLIVLCATCVFVWRPTGNQHEARSPNGAVILGFFLKPNRFAYGEKFFTEEQKK